MVTWAGPLVAWLLAFYGTVLLRNVERRSLGASLCLAGAALAVLLLRRHAAPVGRLAVGSSPAPRRISRRMAALAALALCVLSYVAAITLFLSGRGGLFGVTTWLWAVSIGAIVLAGVLWPSQAAVPVSGRGGRAWALEGLIFVSIVVAAFVTRLYRLGEVPFAIHPDEILTGRNAIAAFLTGNVSPFITVWSGIDLPALWFAAVAASLEQLGHSLTALRAPTALLGATAIIPLYAFLRDSWGRVAAVFGAALFATGACTVHYSRVTLNNHVAALFWIACFFFAARGWRTGRAASWVLAGVMGGIGEHTYYGTRLLPFVLVAFFVYLLVLERRSAARTLGSLLWLGAGYLVAFGPLLAHHLKTPGSYLGRGVGVLTLRSVPFDRSAILEAGSKILALTKDNLLAISTLPDNSSVYWAQLLLAPEAALLSIGALLLVWTWRHPPAFLLLLSGAAVIFVGGVLVPPPRALQHWTPAFACFYAAAAVPVAAWWRRTQTLGRFWRSGAAVVVALALVSTAYMNVKFYFRDYQATRPEFEYAAALARWHAGLGERFMVRTLGNGWIEYQPELTGYLAPGQDAARIADIHAELPVAVPPGKGLAFAFLPRDDRAAAKAYVSCLYPGGVAGEVRSHAASGSVHFFDTYVVPPERASGGAERAGDCPAAAGGAAGSAPTAGSLPPAQ